jgi:DNA polymerase-3 subunit gamma/tau
MVLFAALTTGEVVNCKNGIITIRYDKNYSFNKKRLERSENKKAVEDIFSEMLKERVSIRYEVEVDSIENTEKSQEEMLKNTFGDNMVEIIDE